MRRLVLASTSRYRAELLRRLGVAFEVVAPGVDEEAFKAADPAADQLVRELALAKARAVAARCGDAIVIGSDQCAELDGAILGKPGTAERAAAQLAALSGRTHRLWTGVALVDGRTGTARSHVDCHELSMRALDAAAIARYVESDLPLDCAGSYKIESLGIALFERVEGSDFTAITGLPLTVVVRMLAELGVEVP